MIKHPTHEKILQQNLYLIGELRQSKISVTLAELISLLVDSVLTVRDASRYLKDRYRQNPMPDWHRLTDEEICEHVRLTIKFKQQRQWLDEAEAAARKQRRERQQQEQESKNSPVDQRIRRLKDVMEKCQRQLRICKEEELFVKKREQLQNLRKELKYLQPPENLLAARLLDDQQTSPSFSPQLIENIQSIKGRKKIQSYAKSETSNPHLRKVNIHRMMELFHHYTLKSQRLKPTFDELAHQQLLTVHGFMEVVKDFELCRLLHPNQIYDLFRQNSADKKHVDFDGFVQLLRDVHRLEASKQSRECDEVSQNIYMNTKLLNTQRMDLLLHRKANPDKFNYEFKIIPHTGKSKEEIVAELIKRREKKLGLVPAMEESLISLGKSPSSNNPMNGSNRKSTNNLKTSPTQRRRASQPNIFHRNHRYDEESPQHAILRLLPAEEDPYLDTIIHRNQSTVLPSLKRFSRYQF